MTFDNTAAALDKAAASGEETGASIVVNIGGKTVFTHNAGLADAENTVPFTENTICRAFSCTKVATSVACMLLVERGILDTADEL